MRRSDAPGKQAGARAPYAAAPTPGPRGAKEAVESLRDQFGAPLEALSGSGRTQPAFPPLTNPRIQPQIQIVPKRPHTKSTSEIPIEPCAKTDRPKHRLGMATVSYGFSLGGSSRATRNPVGV